MPRTKQVDHVQMDTHSTQLKDDKHLNKLTLVERFDMLAAKTILYNAGELGLDHTQVLKLKSYIRRAGHPDEYGVSSVQITYKQTEYGGRFTAEGGIGLQCLFHPIRGTISGDLYTDVDIQNCHPVLIVHQFRDLFDMPTLSLYVDRRDEVLAKFVTGTYTRDKVKRDCLQTLYGSKVYKMEEGTDFGIFLKSLYDELQPLYKYVNDKYPHLSDPSSMASALSKYIQMYETKLMDTAVQHLQNDYNLADEYVRIHDGCMIPKHVGQGEIEDMLASLSDEVYDKHSVRVKFTTKAFEKYDLSVLKPYEELRYDVNEPYYFNDMLNELRGYNDIKEDEFYVEVEKRIGRVMFCVEDHKFYIKCSPDQPFGIYDTSKSIMSYNVLIPHKLDGELEYRSTIIHLKKVIANCLRTGVIKNYRGITIDPSIPIRRVIDDNVNTFGGFKAKLLPTEQVQVDRIQPIIDHLFNIWAGGDTHIYKYIMTWLHTMFHGKKTGIMMVLQSEAQGSGKSIIFESFIQPLVMGYSSCCNGTFSKLTQNFNDHLVGKVCYVMEELSIPTGEYHQVFDRVKDLITGATISIEAKYQKTITVPNHLNLIGFTNNNFAVKTERSDRRYFLQQVKEDMVGNYEYFNRLIASFTTEAANHFFSYVYHYTDTVNLKIIPDTELRRENLEASQPSPIRFLKDGIRVLHATCEDEMPDLPQGTPVWYDCMLELRAKGEVAATKVYASYTVWCAIKREATVKDNVFGRYCTPNSIQPLGLVKKEGRARKQFYRWIDHDQATYAPKFIRDLCYHRGIDMSCIAE